MDLNNQVGEIIEQGKQTITNAAKTAVSDSANSVATQIGLKPEPTVQPQTQANIQENSSVSGDITKQMVGDYYSASPQTSNESPVLQEEQETAEKLKNVRLELDQHKREYYDQLIAYENKKVEHPAETAEREEQQKIQELNLEDTKKLPSIAVRMAQTRTERNPGVVG